MAGKNWNKQFEGWVNAWEGGGVRKMAEWLTQQKTK